MSYQPTRAFYPEERCTRVRWGSVVLIPTVSKAGGESGPEDEVEGCGEAPLIWIASDERQECRHHCHEYTRFKINGNGQSAV